MLRHPTSVAAIHSAWADAKREWAIHGMPLLILWTSLGFSTFPNMLDNASLPYPALFRLRGPAPDTVPLLILRATALLSPSVPIMCTFEPHDVAPGQIARPLQGASGSFGFLSPTSLARALHAFGNPIVIERLTYTWIALTQVLIHAVEDVTLAILLSRARAPRDDAFDAARNFRNVVQPRKRVAARERVGRRRVRRKKAKTTTQWMGRMRMIQVERLKMVHIFV